MTESIIKMDDQISDRESVTEFVIEILDHV